MTLDSGLFLDNADRTGLYDLYELADNSEFILSPNSKETTHSPESLTAELDWHFNEQFQELSSITEVEPCPGGVAMTHSNIPSTSTCSKDTAPLETVGDLSDMLSVAFEALDESFPDGVLDFLPAAPSVSSALTTSIPEETDSVFDNLVPTTITEACDGTEEKQKSVEVVKTPTQKSRKRKINSKSHSATVKQCKLENVDTTDLVVELKPFETEQQAIRRVKNNYASRVFRSKRKTKLDEMLTKEEELTRHNASLRNQLQTVMEVVSLLKEGLINKCNSRNTK